MEDELNDAMKWIGKQVKRSDAPVVGLIRLSLTCLVLLIIVWLAIVINWDYGDTDSLQKIGLVGDSFGVINAIFSVLAFFFVALSMWLTQKNASRQSSENHFFQLLASWRNVVANLVAVDIKPLEAQDKIGFTALKLYWEHVSEEVDKEMKIRDSRSRVEFRKFHVENILFGATVSTQCDLNHYFRILYHILKYIDQANVFTSEDKFRYVQIVRAHMSEEELQLLYYNCYLDKSSGMHKYIRKYSFMSVMNHVPKYDVDWEIYEGITGVKLSPSTAIAIPHTY